MSRGTSKTINLSKEEVDSLKLAIESKVNFSSMTPNTCNLYRVYDKLNGRVK